MKTKVIVGIISHDPGEMLERCLNGLCRHNAGIDYELKLQLTPGSHAENWNRLMARCDADYVCILEDDTAPIRANWLSSMVDMMEKYPDCAIVMPIETKDGENPDPGFVQWLDKTMQAGATYAFCNLIRKSAGLQADENLTYFVDIDLARQAIHNGFVNIVNGHVWMLHGTPEGGRMSDDPKIKETQQKDNLYLKRKWPRAA